MGLQWDQAGTRQFRSLKENMRGGGGFREKGPHQNHTTICSEGVTKVEP